MGIGTQLKNLEKRFRPQITLFAEGDTSREMYILMSGAVGIYKNNREIATIDSEGQYFGEMSTLLGAPRSATVKTLEDSRFLVIPPERVQDFFQHSPTLAIKVARGLAERLSKTTDDLALARADVKKASYELNKLYKDVTTIATRASNNPEARKNIDLRLLNVVQKLAHSRFIEDKRI
jgi:CRP-like cAMP-binding protein